MLYKKGSSYLPQMMKLVAVESISILNMYLEARDAENIRKATIASEPANKRKRRRSGWYPVRDLLKRFRRDHLIVLVLYNIP